MDIYNLGIAMLSANWELEKATPHHNIPQEHSWNRLSSWSSHKTFTCKAFRLRDMPAIWIINVHTKSFPSVNFQVAKPTHVWFSERLSKKAVRNRGQALNRILTYSGRTSD